MYRETLEELGLSPTEAKIYETLITAGASSVPEISLHISVHRRNVYDTMPKLLKRGLVYLIADANENTYAAVPPDKLQDLLYEKETRLQAILPGLNERFKKRVTQEAVYIYKGIEGFKNYLRDILKIGEDVYFIGAKGGWFDPHLQTFIQHFLNKAREKHIRYHHIFDHEVRTEAPELLKALGLPYRFLPKEYSTTGAIDIFGDRVVTFSGLVLKRITEDVMLVVISNRELADCYRTWFQFVWDHCK